MRPLRNWLGDVARGFASWLMLPLIVQKTVRYVCVTVIVLGIVYFACRFVAWRKP